MKAIIISGAIGILIFSGLAAPKAGADEVRPNISYVYFQVPHIQGKTVPEMIRISSPIFGRNGHRFIGLTKWQIGFEKMTVTTPSIGVCRVAEPMVTCDCEITLPQFAGGDEQTRRNFEKIAAETKEHELEHCRIAIKHATELARTFKALKAAQCDDLRKKLIEVYNKAVDDCSVEQKRFDHAEYGYRQYLYWEYLQGMQDAGFDLAPPSEGSSMPRLDGKKRSMEVIPHGVEELEREGIYKDENGVWRNY